MSDSFFFNDTATTEIYTLSLHDALPILLTLACTAWAVAAATGIGTSSSCAAAKPRSKSLRSRIGVNVGVKSRFTRSEEHTSELQSANISYAVFCLKKNKLLNLRLTYCVR